MPKKFLIVEDTEEIREFMYELLTMEGYSVTQASNGASALLHLEGDDTDFIITDLLMPEMSGFDLVKTVRKNNEWNRIPIMVFSAVASEESENRILCLGANVYLKKPSTVEELLAAVNKLIAHEGKN